MDIVASKLIHRLNTIYPRHSLLIFKYVSKTPIKYKTELNCCLGIEVENNGNPEFGIWLQYIFEAFRETLKDFCDKVICVYVC